MNPTAITLKAELQQNLNDLGFTELTPVQQASLPLILANRDLIAQAQTGSGKTAAFALGMLQLLDVKRFRIQSLVLCPTRELADQVATEIRKLGRAIHNIKVLTLCGGVPFGPQLGSLEHGAHIIVGTPGRIEEHLQKGSLQLQDLNLLVLDEADRMLEMGFAPSLDAIVQQTPKNRQTLLFSATFPQGVQQLTGVAMRPQYATVDCVGKEVSTNHQVGARGLCCCCVRWVGACGVAVWASRCPPSIMCAGGKAGMVLLLPAA